MNDLTEELKAKEYRLLKPLPGFPVGYVLKVERSGDSVYLESKGMVMTFARSFLDVFPGWFSPIYKEQTSAKL